LYNNYARKIKGKETVANKEEQMAPDGLYHQGNANKKIDGTRYQVEIPSH